MDKTAIYELKNLLKENPEEGKAKLIALAGQDLEEFRRVWAEIVGTTGMKKACLSFQTDLAFAKMVRDAYCMQDD